MTRLGAGCLISHGACGGCAVPCSVMCGSQAAPGCERLAGRVTIAPCLQQRGSHARRAHAPRRTRRPASGARARRSLRRRWMRCARCWPRWRRRRAARRGRARRPARARRAAAWQRPRAGRAAGRPGRWRARTSPRSRSRAACCSTAWTCTVGAPPGSPLPVGCPHNGSPFQAFACGVAEAPKRARARASSACATSLRAPGALALRR